MKTCCRCDGVKPSSDFYKAKSNADGRANKCKDCTKKSVVVNYYENRDHYLKYKAAYGKAYAKTESGKLSSKNRGARWRSKYPKKRTASDAVSYAIRSGKIIKLDICEDCRSKPSVIHGHHDDYDKKLQVRWLCGPCHKKWHRENGEGANGV